MSLVGPSWHGLKASFSHSHEKDQSLREKIEDRFLFLRTLYTFSEKEWQLFEACAASSSQAEVEKQCDLLVSLCNQYKKSFEGYLFEQFLESLLGSHEPFQISKVLQKVLELREEYEGVLHAVEQFVFKERTFVQLEEDFDALYAVYCQKKFPEKPLGRVVEQFSKKTQHIQFPLSPKELREVRRKYQAFSKIVNEKIKGKSKEEIRETVATIKDRAKVGRLSEKELLTLLAGASSCIESLFHIRPYNTQIMTVLALLQSPPSMKGRLAQVRTGEGKSTIIALLAFVEALQNRCVDIVSSNRYLAKYDQRKYAPFFAHFGITTSHICEDMPTKDNFKGQILYGTNYDFEFAWMRFKLYLQRFRKGTMDVVIVDEADNLFIDNALNAARIAIPVKNSPLEKALRPIFTYVEQNQVPSLLVKDWYETHSSLEEIPPHIREIVEKVHGTDNKWKTIQLISSAYKALYERKLNRDYVIKKVKDARSQSEKEEVVIVDFRVTGRLKEKSRWNQGLHEFLEIKHHLPPKGESMTNASLCHPVYFSMYKKIYGLSGTLGQDLERKELETQFAPCRQPHSNSQHESAALLSSVDFQEEYGVDTFDVPSHRESIRKVEPPLVLSSKEEHYKALLQDIHEKRKNSRPVLILWETIQEVEEFGAFLSQNSVHAKQLTETQKISEDLIVASAGEPCSVTVATHTAGRGTDILLYPESKENGGLHVIFARYPENDRVEAQGFGRSGRQGQPGSNKLIACLEGVSDPEVGLGLLKTKRALSVALQSKHRAFRSFMEKINHLFLERFLNAFQTFMERDEKSFSKKTLKAFVASHKDEHIIELVHASFPFLKKEESEVGVEDPFLGKRIKQFFKEKAEESWASSFYNPLQDFEEDFSKRGVEDREQYRATATEMFESRKNEWFRFLNV